MQYSLFSPRPPHHQMHKAFLLWIVGLGKRYQPIDSALNNTCAPMHALCKHSQWKLIEWPKLDGSLYSWRVSMPENPFKTWVVGKIINIKD